MSIEWTALIGEASIAGGVVAGIIICYKIRRNGCPAQAVLDEAKTVNKGLTEAVNRNTAASERQTDVMSKLAEKLIKER